MAAPQGGGRADGRIITEPVRDEALATLRAEMDRETSR